MKRSFLALAVVVLVVSSVFVGFAYTDDVGLPVGDIIAIDNVDGVSTATTSPAPPFADIEGEDGWAFTLVSDPSTGIDFYVYDIKAGAASFPIHDGGPGVWLTYVAQGSGDVILGDQDANETGTQHYVAGDYIIFQPNTLHGWQPSDEDTVLIFAILQAQ